MSQPNCALKIRHSGLRTYKHGGVVKINSRIGVSLVVTALLLTGCSKGTSSVAGSASPSSSPTKTKDPVFWPFTQLPGPDNAAEVPVVVIKIENDPSVRPQAGLDSADLVFEELVEGGMTRFGAVFQSDIPKEAGPVRSARHVDVSIASPIADYFVFSGAAKPTIAYVKKNLPKSIVISTEGAPGMHRTKYHPAPHNLYMYLADLIASNKAAVSPTAGFFTLPLGQTAAPVGSPVTAVRLTFSKESTPGWTWDAGTKLWLRDDGNKPHKAMDGKQLSANSLVVIKTTEVNAGYKDPAGHYVPRTVLTGTGSGYLLTDGQMIDVTWTKADTTSQMTLTTADGSVVGPLPGKTWVEVITTSGSVAFKVPAAASPSPSKS